MLGILFLFQATSTLISASNRQTTSVMKHFILLFLSITVLSAFGQDGEYHLNKKYKMNKAGRIDLRLSDAKVVIVGIAGEEAHVKIDRKVTTKGLFYSSTNEFNITVENESGDLIIKEIKRSMNSGVITYWNEEYKVEIEAPEGASLTVRGDDGDYYIKNINGAISLTLDDADAEISDCKGNQFSFRMDDGDVRMNQGQGSLEIDADDANLTVYNGKFSSIQANVDDGDLVIETSLADNGSYNLDAQDGLISLTVTGGGGEFDIRHDDASVSTNGNFKVNEESESRTNVSLSAGKAKVHLRADDARIKLNSSL
jgi:hypothetical protein